MKKVTLLRQYLSHAPGEVVEVRDWDAILLIRQGRAKYQEDGLSDEKAVPKTNKGKKPKK